MIQTDIGRLLDKHKPVGAQWVVLINDEGFLSTYGPFDEYGMATAWVSLHEKAVDHEVLPLYQPA